MENNREPEGVNDANAMKSRGWIKTALKFLVVVFIFWLLFKNDLINGDSVRLILASPQFLALNMILFATNFLLSSYRWQILLRVHGIFLTFPETVRYALIGNFFNIALPGAVSGDVVKAVYIANRYQDLRAAIFGSILFDRVLGVSALVLVAAISALIGEWVDWGGQLPPALIYSIYGLAAGVVFFFIYLFSSKRHDPLLGLFVKFTHYSKKLGSLERIYRGVMHYRSQFGTVFRALILSLFIHTFVVTVAFLFAKVLSPEPLRFLGLAVVVPIGMLATAVPVLPAGVGTGHLAFYGLFQLLGSAVGVEVYSWLVLLQVIAGAIGGVVYLRTPLIKGSLAIGTKSASGNQDELPTSPISS